MPQGSIVQDVPAISRDDDSSDQTDAVVVKESGPDVGGYLLDIRIRGNESLVNVRLELRPLIFNDERRILNGAAPSEERKRKYGEWQFLFLLYNRHIIIDYLPPARPTHLLPLTKKRERR